MSDVEMKKQNNNIQNEKSGVQHWQLISIFLVIYDIFAVNFAFGGALWLRFDGKFSAISAKYLDAFSHFCWIYTVLVIIVFVFFKMYNTIWRFASFNELKQIVYATAVSFVIQCVGITVFFCRMPISYYVFGISIQFVLTSGIRFSYRFINLLRSRYSRRDLKYNVMIIGAGSSGQMLNREISNGNKDTEDKVCCFIDDNPNKWGRYIDNVIVAGGRNEILRVCNEMLIDKIYFAIPSASAEDRREILQICTETDCEIKQLPGMYELINEVQVSSLQDVRVEDLLGREPITADMSEVYSFIHGKTVLVTGGGGSIGSELCRQVAAHAPKQLIIFDIYENNAYLIQLELKEKYPELNLVTLIGSVRDSRRVNQVFAEYKPDVVYHAAAHKHVPLMEDSPCESIKNNVMGTYKCCYAAMKNHCKRFVLISSDKAVNPTNVMGASKRLCEMVVQTFDYMLHHNQAEQLPAEFADDKSGMQPDSISFRGENSELPITEYVAVRFGNVLGSNGSVVPIFKKQIEKGGPVTVTHPDIIRYFMTVPEAVSLVMLAGTYARGGEIFVLDMGSPVKIDTLARNLIRLAGLRPDVDIKIEYSGLRPGEKLYEEKLMAEEGLKKTDNDLIHIAQPIPFNYDSFLSDMETLEYQAYDNNEKDIRNIIKQIVSTYHPELGAKG